MFVLSGECQVDRWGVKMPRGRIPNDDLPEAVKRSPALERTGDVKTGEERPTTQK